MQAKCSRSQRSKKLHEQSSFQPSRSGGEAAYSRGQSPLLRRQQTETASGRKCAAPVPERFCFFSQLICSFSGHFQPDADIQTGRQSFFFENRRIRWVPARPPQIRPTGKEISDTLKNFLSDDILIFIFIMSEESRKR